jgi:hypothetical protein
MKMLFILIWSLVLVGIILLLERNSKEAFYEYCRLECGDWVARPVINQVDGYVL